MKNSHSPSRSSGRNHLLDLAAINYHFERIASTFAHRITILSQFAKFSNFIPFPSLPLLGLHLNRS